MGNESTISAKHSDKQSRDRQHADTGGPRTYSMSGVAQQGSPKRDVSARPYEFHLLCQRRDQLPIIFSSINRHYGHGGDKHQWYRGQATDMHTLIRMIND